jgi:hypothetical protein
MNEKLKEFWDKAAKLEQDQSWEGQTRFMQKFGELIVAECIDICENTRYDGTVAANRIKFVFGLDAGTK